MYVMLLLTLVAVGASVSQWLYQTRDTKPMTAPATAYSEQQVADAKSKICSAFENVWNAEKVAGGRNGGTDPTATLAVATSIRQVLDFGSRYLVNQLGAEPATPADLATAVRQLSDIYQELTINYLDGLTNADPKLGPLLSALDKQTYTVQGLCK
jgi:hypothetical protein